MKIIGLGTDIEECSRFDGKDELFLNRVFTKNEIEYCKSFKNYSERFAGKFCAKEACIKALNDKSISLKNIEILNDENGKPSIFIKENRYQNYIFMVSVSHTNNYATAAVIVTI